MEKEIIRICGKIFRKETGSIVWIIKLRIGGRVKYEIRQTGKGDNNQSILLSLEELTKVKEIIEMELKKEKEIEKENGDYDYIPIVAGVRSIVMYESYHLNS